MIFGHSNYISRTCNQRLTEIKLAIAIVIKTRLHVLVGNPAETTEDEQTPLVTAHANILNGAVDNLGFPYKAGGLTGTSHASTRADFQCKAESDKDIRS